MLNARDIIQINATIITGLLILLTISSLNKPDPTDNELIQIRSEIDEFLKNKSQLDKAGNTIVDAEKEAIQEKLSKAINKKYAEFVKTPAGVVYQLIPFFAISAIAAGLSAFLEDEHPKASKWLLKWPGHSWLIFSFGLLAVLITKFTIDSNIP